MAHYFESEILTLNFHTLHLLDLADKIGVYVLLNERNEVLYVGRSIDLNNRLTTWCNLNNVYPKFKFWLFSNDEDGYKKECELYYRFDPPHNDINPHQPRSSLENYSSLGHLNY